MREKLSRIWFNVQGKLFPYPEKTIEEPLTEKLKQLVAILELIRIEDFIRVPSYQHGQSLRYRKNIARAFVAKAVYNMSTARQLIDMLKTSPALRKICGWERASEIPHESTFSRAFAEFANAGLTVVVHDDMVAEYLVEEIVGHISRDSTAIEGREKPTKKKKVKAKPKRRRGRPKKGEEVVKEPAGLERQQTMTPEEMLEDLPRNCDVGTARDTRKLG